MKRFMKKFILAVAVFILLFSAASCSTSEVPQLSETKESTASSVPAEHSLPPSEPLESFTNPLEPAEQIDLFFPCSSHDLLTTQYEKTEKDFENACSIYEEQGYTLYSSMEIGGNLSKTYRKDASLAHLYYHPAIRELNVVLSDMTGETLPPATPEVTSGDFECTVTQLNQVSHKSGGMGYVIRLQDGSFLIFDGGMEASADEILEILREQSPTELPLIRAWIFTHFHSDHYNAFHAVAQRAKKEKLFTLETVIASPIVEGYRNFLESFSANIFTFPEAKFVFAHTGMKFNFCNLTLEILYTPENLFKGGQAIENFNDTSMLTRLRDENHSMLITGDLALQSATLCETLYGESLASDWCQMSHHGLEDCPLSFYEKVKSSLYWVPTTTEVYRQERNLSLRQAVEALPTTEEILIAGAKRYTRPWKSE